MADLQDETMPTQGFDQSKLELPLARYNPISPLTARERAVETGAISHYMDSRGEPNISVKLDR